MKGRYLLFALAISSAVLLAGCGTKTQKASAGGTPEKAITTAPAPASAPKAIAEGPNTGKSPSPITAPKSYSADIVTSGPGGHMTSKLAVDGENKARTEMAGQIVIMRRDKGKMWMLNKATKTAMEMPISEQMVKDMEKGRFEDRSKLKRIGQDTLDGYLCDKYLVTNQGTTATTWIAKKIGLPIKIESAGSTIHFTNIKVGPQPASLFELDPGYSVQQMPDMSKMDQSTPKPGGMPALPKGVTIPGAPR